MRLVTTLILLSVLVDPTTNVAGIRSLSECGYVSLWDDCPVFFSFATGYTYAMVMDSFPDSLEYRSVIVAGDTQLCHQPCGGLVIDTCIVVTQMSECQPDDMGCGVLSGPYYDESCWLWTSSVHGAFASDLPDGYSPGDTIGVMAVVNPYCASYCPTGDGCFWYGTIYYPCADTTTAVETRSWGSIKALFWR